MAQYIDKSALVAEIEKCYNECLKRAKIARIIDSNYWNTKADAYRNVLVILDNTLEVKEVEECKQPEYSCLETIYQCGKKPHWNVGDTLAYYGFYSDREGECVLGKVTKVEFDEEQCDWFYTFEDGSIYDEQSLLEDQTYKKN